MQEAFEEVTKEVIGKQNVLLKSSGAADPKAAKGLRSGSTADGKDDKGNGKKKKCC